MFLLRPCTILLLCAAAIAQPPNKKTSAAGGITLQPGTTVEAKAGDKNIPLKPPEKIALAFIHSIRSLEDDCRRHAQHICTLAELVQGPKSADSWKIKKLKYDPARDTNYQYVLTPGQNNKWTLQVVPQKPGLAGFFVDGSSFMGDTYYNPKGPATNKDTKLTEMGMSGELFSQ
jgi:hypothetical protein